MMTSKRIGLFAVILLLSMTMISFQNFTDEDQENQNETLDTMQIEDEVLQTSTDDLKAQQNEAREQAEVMEHERSVAAAKLSKTKIRREAIEGEATVKIAENATRRQEALEKKNLYLVETAKLQREIAALEQRIEKSEREARVANEEARRVRANFLQMKTRKGQLLETEKTKADKRKSTSGLSRMGRRVASYISREESRSLPRALPAKRSR